VAFSPDGKRVVSGSYDKTVRLRDATTGKPIGGPLKGHDETVNSVAFSPDGTRIVSSSADRTIRLWNASTGKLIGEPFRGHEDTVWSTAFSPDGMRIASGSVDKTVRIWFADWATNWESPLKNACELLRHHVHLIEPTTEVAKEAAQTCKQYAWK
jgi:WD40 repeat protein